MFDVDYIHKPYTSYKEKYPLYARFEQAYKAKNMGKKNVLYIVPGLYTAAHRYRAENVQQVVCESNEWNILILEEFNAEIILQHIELVDIIIFMRIRYSNAKKFVDSVCKMNIPMYFEIDDYCFHMDCLEEVFKALPVKSSIWINKIADYLKVINCCNGFVTTTEYLKKEIEGKSGKSVFIIKNFLNYDQCRLGKEYTSQKTDGRRYRSPLYIGYLGAEDHQYDLQLIENALDRILSMHKDTVLLISSRMAMPEKLKKYQLSNQIMTIPYVDGNALMYYYAQMDLNLIPLVNNKFSESRSEIKYFEAAAVGTKSIASTMAVYKEIAGKGNLIRLCEDDEWTDAIQSEISAMQSNLASTLCKESLKLYGAENQRNDIEKVFCEMVNSEGVAL